MLRPSQKRVAGLPAIPREGEVKHHETLKYYQGVRAERKAREDARLTAEIKAVLAADDPNRKPRRLSDYPVVVCNRLGDKAIHVFTHFEFYLAGVQVSEVEFCQGFQFVA